MYTGILMFLVGAIVGLVIGVWRLSASVKCEIHIVQADEEQPYLYLALNKPVSYLMTKKYVLAEIKKDDYISQ